MVKSTKWASIENILTLSLGIHYSVTFSISIRSVLLLYFNRVSSFIFNGEIEDEENLKLFSSSANETKNILEKKKET